MAELGLDEAGVPDKGYIGALVKSLPDFSMFPPEQQRVLQASRLHPYCCVFPQEQIISTK